MPSSGAQTEVTVYPTEARELSRWFRGFDAGEERGFAAFEASAEQEMSLVEEKDVLQGEEEKTTRDFVAVADKTGKVVRVRRISDSGKRILVARGAFSLLEKW
jgi:hypothetical protein